jgi:hypothetical protein
MAYEEMKRAGRLLSGIALFVVTLCSGIGAQGYTAYTVREGDSLARIAGHYLPQTDAYTAKELIKVIMEINGLSTQNLSIGKVLNIPVVRDTPVKASRVAKPRDFAARGLYVNQANAGTREIFTLAEKLRKKGGNTVVFDAKEIHGSLAYRSRVPGTFTPVTSYPSNIEEISKLIDNLHRMDVHVVARVCMFRDILMANTMKDWKYSEEWVNPASRKVQDYNLAIIRELIGLGVDEIQLDYFRYPADGKTSTGIKGKVRSDILAEYLARIHDLTSSHQVLLSLDMFGIVIWQRDVDIDVLGQDVKKIKAHLDIISPMLYPSHFGKNFSGVKNPADEPYYFVSRGIQRVKAIVGDQVVIRPWLQSFPLKVTAGYGPGYIQAQIDATRDAGASGWLLWSPGNRYQEAFTAMEKTGSPSRSGKDVKAFRKQGGH